MGTSFDVFVFLTSTENGMDHAKQILLPLENKSVMKSVVNMGKNVTGSITKALTGKEGSVETDGEY